MSSQPEQLTYLSSDANVAIQDIMDSIGVLSGIYSQETSALADSNTKEFLSLQEQKFEAARTYQIRVEDLLNRKDEMNDVTPDKKAQLKKMQKEFSELSEKNKEALERMGRCMERVSDSIRLIAKEAVNKQRSINYGECGNIKNTDHKSVSIGINETA